MIYIESSDKVDTSSVLGILDGYICVGDLNNCENIETLKERINEEFNYSFDGQIYWFHNLYANNVLKYLKNYLNDHRDEMEDTMAMMGISNLIGFKQLKTGIAIIDTQVDQCSIINEIVSNMLGDLDIDNDSKNYIEYYDCHLIDNLNLARGMGSNEDLIFLQEDGLLKDDVLFDSLLNLDCTLPVTKIALIGNFNCSNDDIENIIKDSDYFELVSIEDAEWIWVGQDIDIQTIYTSTKKSYVTEILKEIDKHIEK